jgi:hypothetical protein
LKFVALLPRARFTEVRAEVWLPFMIVEPPLGGQRVPRWWVSGLESRLCMCMWHRSEGCEGRGIRRGDLRFAMSVVSFTLAHG